MSGGRIGPGYAGLVEPRVWLSFKSTTVAGAHAGAVPEYLYELRNPSVFESTLTFTTPTRSITLTRRATPSDPRFDATFGFDTFVFDPVSAADLDAILDAHDLNQLTGRITLKLRYLKFFLRMLEQMTRTAGDNNNLARPANQADIEASFTHTRSGRRAQVTHIEEQRELRDLPCMLSSDWDIDPPATPGGAPSVKLYVYLLVRERLTAAQRDEVVRLFMAMNHTGLYERGTRSPLPDPATLRLLDSWVRNERVFLGNHTSFDRGERIRQEVVSLGNAAVGRPMREAVRAVRDAIDARLVTANHWGDLREDWATEQYQRKLSDLFGAIHQDRPLATPVKFLRDIEGAFHLNTHESAALALQYGTGHCGEHAKVSASVMATMIDTNSAAAGQFFNIIRGGFANVDHDFVVGGFEVFDALEVVTRHPDVFHVAAGSTIVVYDLQAALAALPGMDTFVLDPYLAPSRQSETGAELLARINSSRRRAGATVFLRLSEQYPSTSLRVSAGPTPRNL